MRPHPRAGRKSARAVGLIRVGRSVQRKACGQASMIAAWAAEWWAARWHCRFYWAWAQAYRAILSCGGNATQEALAVFGVYLERISAFFGERAQARLALF